VINRVYKRDRIWYADYTDPQTRSRKRIAVGPSKHEALSVIAKARAQAVEGKFFDVRKTPSTTFICQILTGARGARWLYSPHRPISVPESPLYASRSARPA